MGSYVCGEIAGDPRYAPLLVGLGLRELSMSAAALPRVKQRVRALDRLSATRCAQVIMEQSDSGRITALLDDFNSLRELGTSPQRHRGRREEVHSSRRTLCLCGGLLFLPALNRPST